MRVERFDLFGGGVISDMLLLRAKSRESFVRKPSDRIGNFVSLSLKSLIVCLEPAYFLTELLAFALERVGLISDPLELRQRPLEAIAFFLGGLGLALQSIIVVKYSKEDA